MAPELMTAVAVQNDVMDCAYSVAEAAKNLGVSEATIRRQCRSLGVTRVAGSTVAGFVVWRQHPVPIKMPACRLTTPAH